MEPARDSWGINAFAALCNKEDGHNYIPGSIDKHLQRTKSCLVKGLDQFINRKSVSQHHKMQLQQLKNYLEGVASSEGILEIVKSTLEITLSYKEHRMKR